MLTGEIPSGLFNIKGLKHLTLNGNSLTWNKNEKIVPKCMLSDFSMNSCGSGGEIPDWISSQKRLDYLDLGGNQLEGVFPQWLAEMQVTSIAHV
ncbi:LRR receptor-like serine/threonine-protein kinase GSO2 [Fagus crenata]